jgi:hypothetical protein
MGFFACGNGNEKEQNHNARVDALLAGAVDVYPAEQADIRVKKNLSGGAG